MEELIFLNGVMTQSRTDLRGELLKAVNPQSALKIKRKNEKSNTSLPHTTYSRSMYPVTSGHSSCNAI